MSKRLQLWSAESNLRFFNYYLVQVLREKKIRNSAKRAKREELDKRMQYYEEANSFFFDLLPDMLRVFVEQGIEYEEKQTNSITLLKWVMDLYESDAVSFYWPSDHVQLIADDQCPENQLPEE